MPPRVDAIIFDLYGTLLRIARPMLYRGIPRTLGVAGREWRELVRGRLLTSSFTDRAEFVQFLSESLAPAGAGAKAQACLALVEGELDSVEPFQGVLPLLAFLKRRGYALGLISNLTSVHKEPVRRFRLDEHFAAVSFSCDTGVLKPDPRSYLDLCARLGVDREAVLVVGDSLPNDVEAPRSLGMQAVRVSPAGSNGAIATAAELGWMLLGGPDHLTRLFGDGKSSALGGSRLVLGGLRPVPDDEQGRYNLVASARAVPADRAEPCEKPAAPVEVFCKRFLFPEAAYVEEFAHRLVRRIGMPSCDVVVEPGPEPCLLLSKAPGVKLEGEPDPALAFEIGRHCAVGYLFASADLRPRNAFVAIEGGQPIVTMVDLEHWFFNLALDLDGLADPFRPATFDALPADELARRVQKQVLTERTTRRAMRSFIEIDSESSERGRAFKAGWIAAYARVKSDGEEICRWIDERVHTEPFLVIGTQSHRRAMARFDVEDIRRRMAEDPEELFPRLAALKRKE